VLRGLQILSVTRASDHEALEQQLTVEGLQIPSEACDVDRGASEQQLTVEGLQIRSAAAHIVDHGALERHQGEGVLHNASSWVVNQSHHHLR
jgi:hypothetical protein